MSFVPFGFHPLWIIGLLVISAAVAAVAVLVIWAVLASNRTAAPVGRALQETPQEILARRFASGEITAEDYERARDLLGGAKT